MLDKDELKRRIDAFRTLRGLTQVDLAELFASKGHGSQELGRLERGALPLTEIRRRSLAEILGVPERWFVDQRLDLASSPAGATRLDRIEAALTERADHDRKVSSLLEKQNELLARQSDILTRIEALLSALQTPTEDQEPAESAGFEVPTVPQELRDVLSPQPATQKPVEGTRRKRGSGGRGA